MRPFVSYSLVKKISRPISRGDIICDSGAPCFGVWTIHISPDGRRADLRGLH